MLCKDCEGKDHTKISYWKCCGQLLCNHIKRCPVCNAIKPFVRQVSIHKRSVDLIVTTKKSDIIEAGEV